MIIVYALIGIPASIAVARALFLFCTDPGDRVRVRMRMAGRRIAACFALVSLLALVSAGCDPGVPQRSVGPAFGADPAYSSCEAEPADVSAALCVNASAYGCITVPSSPLAYGCTQPAPTAKPLILCCPTVAYDGGPAHGGAIGCEYCPDGGACAPCDGGGS